jgi:NAD-dependent deacetylase
MWNNFKIEEVSSIEGWRKDPQKVLDFHNDLRKRVTEVEPNDAHRLIAKLEELADVTVITQNIDDLHERAGSTNVIHMHGEIFKVREDFQPEFYIQPKIMEFRGDLHLGNISKRGHQMRPDVVWFGESVKGVNEILQAMDEADAYVVVGTSLQVSPANTLHYSLRPGVPMVLIDPDSFLNSMAFKRITMPATTGMKHLYDNIDKFIKLDR